MSDTLAPRDQNDLHEETRAIARHVASQGAHVVAIDFNEIFIARAVAFLGRELQPNPACAGRADAVTITKRSHRRCVSE